MSTHTLIVSHPPQNGIDVDRAARCLGLDAQDMQGKVRYAVPEIWAAEADPARGEDIGGELRLAGGHVVVTTSEELLRVPARHRVKSFSFTESGLVAHVDSGDVTLPYSVPVIAVSCRPRDSADRPSGGTRTSGRTSGLFSIRDRIMETGSSGAGAAMPDTGTVPFLDIYFTRNGSAERISVLQNAVSFSGLGRLQPRAASNMASFVDSCEDRFSRAHVDRRLEDMRLRRPDPSGRAGGAEHRRGYSFASPAFNRLMTEIDADDLGQAEFSARLAFLTDRAG